MFLERILREVVLPEFLLFDACLARLFQQLLLSQFNK